MCQSIDEEEMSLKEETARQKEHRVQGSACRRSQEEKSQADVRDEDTWGRD